MVNVKTAEHSAHTVVFYAFKANNTILHKIFACLHSNQGYLNILIQLFQKVVTYCESSPLDANFINNISLSNTINSLVEYLVPLLVLGYIIMIFADMNIGAFWLKIKFIPMFFQLIVHAIYYKNTENYYNTYGYAEENIHA